MGSIDCTVPRWLAVMRAITGLTEDPGSGDNPRIMAMRDWIACTYANVDGMMEYCELYTGDDVAWCGLCTGFACTVAGIMPPFGETDTDRFLWAQSFASDPGFFKIDEPRLGAICVMTRSGGGHVMLFEGWVDTGTSYKGRGGNQSDAINVQTFYVSDLIGFYWPRSVPLPPVNRPERPERPDNPRDVPIEDRPDLSRGDDGDDVVDLQKLLPRFNGEIDGDFGPATEDAVLRYQQSRGLEADGVVGEQTWTALYEHKMPLPPPEPPPGALDYRQQAAIIRIARESWIADYDWDERGRAPVGYTQGMALAFAQSYLKLRANHPAVLEMAKARTSSDKDVFNEYLGKFNALGMSNEVAGVSCLRHLYALMLGSGMRESSGRHCEGRDMSASNVEAETCEAGLFQTSYNASGASDPEFDELMVEYSDSRNEATCYLQPFSEEVSCTSSEWESYGSGPGREFQDLCKCCPAFAVETHALTLRNLCNHYGPIIRGEVELKSEAEEMFRQVQDYIDHGNMEV